MIAIAVTVSTVLAHIIEVATTYISFGYFDFSPNMEDFLLYGVSVVIAWLVYSITESKPKKEKWAFKILPIISIWGIAIVVIFELIGLGFEYLLEMIADWMFSTI